MRDIKDIEEVISRILGQPLTREEDMPAIMVSIVVDERGVAVSGTGNVPEGLLAMVASATASLGELLSRVSRDGSGRDEDNAPSVAQEPHDHIQCLNIHWEEEGVKPRKIIGHPDLIHPYYAFLGDWCYVSVEDAILLEKAGYNAELHLTPDDKDNLAVTSLKEALAAQKDCGPDGWWNKDSAQTRA